MSGDDGMRFEMVQLADGPRLRCAEQGDRDGQAVVFLHGWPDSGYSFSRVLALLPPHLRALVIDQRGFGDSDRPASGYRIEDFATDVVALLDALGIGDATLVGHSFGTFVARQVAITQPQRVSRLMLIGSGFAASNPVIAALQASLRDLPDPVPVEFARDFQASTAYRPLPADFFARIVAESLKLPARLWCEVIDGLREYDDTELLAQIVAPVLLVWGDQDALFSRAEQDRLLVALPRARLAVYEVTGHCPNWEWPERVAADLIAFVAAADGESESSA